jgi:hypothetical protein
MPATRRQSFRAILRAQGLRESLSSDSILSQRLNTFFFNRIYLEEIGRLDLWSPIAHIEPRPMHEISKLSGRKHAYTATNSALLH